MLESMMKAYAERFARIKANLEVLKVWQQTLIFDLAKWTLCEGLTGPTYPLFSHPDLLINSPNIF
jgi:hypothetical protein